MRVPRQNEAVSSQQLGVSQRPVRVEHFLALLHSTHGNHLQASILLIVMQPHRSLARWRVIEHVPERNHGLNLVVAKGERVPRHHRRRREMKFAQRFHRKSARQFWKELEKQCNNVFKMLLRHHRKVERLVVVFVRVSPRVRAEERRHLFVVPRQHGVSDAHGLVHGLQILTPRARLTRAHLAHHRDDQQLFIQPRRRRLVVPVADELPQFLLHRARIHREHGIVRNAHDDFTDAQITRRSHAAPRARESRHLHAVELNFVVPKPLRKGAAAAAARVAPARFRRALPRGLRRRGFGRHHRVVSAVAAVARARV